MIGKNHVEEDLQLKNFVRTPQESKPRYNWADETASSPVSPRIPVLDHGEQKSFTAGDIATIIGEALTDLMLSRQENDIFTDKNRRLVGQIAQMVSGELALKSRGNGEDDRCPVSAGEVTRIIERALVRNNAYDLARSIVLRYQPDGASADENDLFQLDPAAPMTCRVIRRNGQVVNWNRNKVEIAIRKAFLSQEMDSAPAVDIANMITQRIQKEGAQMIGIEELQDIVQEELMKSGHYKVAAAYVIYRSHRADVRARVEEEARQQAIDRQESMILVNRADGETFLWDGMDLRKRVEFARMGLDLCISGEQIETDLRRSLFPEMTLEDLNKTIILNAKSLIERDADFARFAARILLTFIYEEVLGWNIVTDGLPALGEFHRRAFKLNLQRGVEIDRISPKLLDFELDKLAAALDPAADFEFDFLGIQTLYDRYLLVDKTQKKHRRIETPQLFWMRVAMGLFVGEKSAARTEHITGLYQLYKSRRFCSSTPTLFNSGTHHSQLSSCYLYKVDDSIESIMTRGIAENAFLSKWAGGLGGSWTAVRGTGSYSGGSHDYMRIRFQNHSHYYSFQKR